ncbi:MAG: DUF3501 family protein [Polyangiaceae bacterium]
MKAIDRTEVLGLADYETIRDRFRTRVIAEKKRRRVQLGPKATALFENRDTVLLQIQEMLRTERISRPAAIQHEIDTYNETVPGTDELSCTVMIEIVEKPERDAFLQAVAGFEDHVWLTACGERIRARSADRAGLEPGRTTAVHYLKFPLPPLVAEALRAAAEPGASKPTLELAVLHPAYTVRVEVPRETIVELGEDLRA